MELDQAPLDKLRRLGGETLVGRMISLYLEHAPQRLDAAREALASGDRASLERAFHSLKSSSANVGASEVRDRAGALEALVEQGNFEEVRRTLPALLEAWETALPLLEEAHAAAKAGPA